ncbi:MAG: hypothetical protein Q7U47_12760 [Paludibacter sp.]|nr:hypothetical protein [Paludibacter sp.]
MFEKLNRYFFQKRVKSYINDKPRERRFVNYHKANTVLLLFESDYSEKNPQIRRIIRSLVNDGKKVSAWGYLQKKEISTAILPDFRILHQKDTDWLMKPHVSFMNELDELTFDLLIDLSINEVIPLQYVALQANAFCKAGIKKSEPNICDFVIDIANINSDEEEEPVDINAKYIFDQIIFYLKSIQTSD